MRGGRSPKGGGTANGGLAVITHLLQLQSGRGGHHRRPSGVHGGDDLLGVDPLEVYRGRAEVGVAELALDDVERYAFAGELDGVGVELMRREAPPDTRLGSEPTKLDADTGARPGPASGRAIDDAEQRADRQLNSRAKP
jgi:hypothetical protein